MNGFLLIDKKKDMTSFDVIKNVKREFGKIKIGHSGTLDPQTTGLLVLAIGKGTKLLKLICEDSKKTYVAKMKFGIKTATADIYGEVLETRDVSLNEKEIREACLKFIKTYEQTPPIYSAKKINGKKAYEMARKNIEIDMSIRAQEVTIYNLEILNIDIKKQEVEFITEVSKGTYIRSLVEDIAQELNTIAVMSELRREKTDGFDVHDACEVDGNYAEKFIELDKFLLNFCTGSFEIEGTLFNLIRNGVQIENENIVKKFDNFQKDDRILLINKNNKEIIAIYEKDNEKNRYVPLVML